MTLFFSLCERQGKKCRINENGYQNGYFNQKTFLKWQLFLTEIIYNKNSEIQLFFIVSGWWERRSGEL